MELCFDCNTATKFAALPVLKPHGERGLCEPSSGFFLFISVQLRNFPDNKGSGRLPFRVSLSKVKLSHTGLRYWRFELTTCFDAVSRNLCNVICSRAVVEDLLAWQ